MKLRQKHGCHSNPLLLGQYWWYTYLIRAWHPRPKILHNRHRLSRWSFHNREANCSRIILRKDCPTSRNTIFQCRASPCPLCVGRWTSLRKVYRTGDLPRLSIYFSSKFALPSKDQAWWSFWSFSPDLHSQCRGNLVPRRAFLRPHQLFGARTPFFICKMLFFKI